ncbi:MAG: signal recognition particle-docking protein FtsY [Defluviicoccus sp.]|nr:signal recognition particle-docking protein FtsY [Defluviicoccus sp.]MDE0386095.1 signal recognition particle-docking protein FtsY [Defluviicoccus sp.]
MSERGWLGRLSAGLSRSSARLSGGIAGIFAGRRLDEATLGELEELLIGADLGVEAAARLTDALARRRVERDLGAEDVRALLAADIARILEPVALPLAVDPGNRPHVVLVVGVNGTGKTTTVGKLAKRLQGEGRRVTMAAGDTFRAAAVSQLELWGERVGCPVVSRATGSDAAGLVFDALEGARRDGADVLLVDTAGRLQNRGDLMAELQKIVRVMRKLDPEAPHDCLLVLDATTGQNTHAQVGVFREMTDVTGLIVTKLDGTAKGGVLVALAERFGLPVHAIGVGESEDDLQPFDPAAFADRLVGLVK